jgi:hypothetical protein
MFWPLSWAALSAGTASMTAIATAAVIAVRHRVEVNMKHSVRRFPTVLVWFVAITPPRTSGGLEIAFEEVVENRPDDSKLR